MIRANFRLIRRITFAAILLGLLVCGAEVGVRVLEVAQGRPICPGTDEQCAVDPTRLSVPSWQTDREMKPHASASVKCRDRHSTVEFHTNSLGLRGPEVAIPKPSDTYRIIVLGDETILAPETPDNEHFSQLLGTHLGQQSRIRIEVINASIPGACPLTEYLMFKQKLLTLQPDLVLLHFDWSDVADDRQLRRRTRSDSSGTPLSCPHASLMSTSRKPHPLDTLRNQFRLVDWGLVMAGNHWKRRIAEQSAISRDTATNAYAWLRNEHPDSDIHVNQAFRPIADLTRLSQASYFQFVVLTSPKPWQVSARCTNGSGVRLKSGVTTEAYYPNRAPFDALANFAHSLNVRFADMSGVLCQSPQPEANYLKFAPRWSQEGHRRVADFLARYLMEQVPGPWNSRYFQQEDHLSRQAVRPPEIRWTNATQ